MYIIYYIQCLHINITILINTVNENYLNAPVKKNSDGQIELKNKIQLYGAHKKPTSNIKTQIC